jgi:hypothetical protein
LSKIYQHQYAPITTDNSPVPTKDEKKSAVSNKTESAEVSELKSKLAGYERVMREMKKQIAG